MFTASVGNLRLVGCSRVGDKTCLRTGPSLWVFQVGRSSINSSLPCGPKSELWILIHSFCAYFTPTLMHIQKH